MKESKYWEVKFKFKYPKNPGEDIRVSGSTDSLGNWNIELASKLIYDAKKEHWKIKNYIKISASFNLEYKYLIFKDDHFEKWQDIETNRKVELPEKKKLVFSDEKDDPKTNVKKHLAKTKKKGDSSINLKTSLKATKSQKAKKFQQNKKSKNKITDFNGNEDENEVEIGLNEKKKEEEMEVNLDDSMEKYQELNYDSYSEKEDDIKNTKMISEPLNADILDDKHDIIMVSTYVPFNPTREKDGSIKFILTNEAIYHTLYRVIESKKNIKWLRQKRNNEKTGSKKYIFI